MKKVLILEDEVNIRSFVVINLKRAGYDAIEAGTGQEALDRLKEHPDTGVAILDIMLPDMDGFEVCRNIRATNKQIGIIMLTARTQEMDKVTGLMTGADDYDQALLTGGAYSPDRCPVPPHWGRWRGRYRAFDPGALCDEHPEPHPGKAGGAHPSDPGGVFHFEAVYAESRPGPVSGGHFGCCVGAGL